MKEDVLKRLLASDGQSMILTFSVLCLSYSGTNIFVDYFAPQFSLHYSVCLRPHLNRSTCVIWTRVKACVTSLTSLYLMFDSLKVNLFYQCMYMVVCF